MSRTNFRPGLRGTNLPGYNGWPRMLKSLFAVFTVACAYAQADLSATSCAEEQLLTSSVGRVPASIEFKNATNQTVRVYWRNYNGQRVRYNVLPPATGYTQPTYESHIWVITDISDQCLAIYLPAAGANRAII